MPSRVRSDIICLVCWRFWEGCSQNSTSSGSLCFGSALSQNALHTAIFSNYWMRLSRIWRIVQIKEGVIHRGRRARRITPSKICRILHILWKPNGEIFWMNNIPLIVWLAPWADKMNQIAHCDWLPKPARWSCLACLGLPAKAREKNFSKSQVINPLLTKFFGSRWLDISLILFLWVYGPRLRRGPLE